MMAKVDFGKEADVGENKAISHAANERNDSNLKIQRNQVLMYHHTRLSYVGNTMI